MELQFHGETFHHKTLFPTARFRHIQDVLANSLQLNRNLFISFFVHCNFPRGMIYWPAAGWTSTNVFFEFHMRAFFNLQSPQEFYTQIFSIIYGIRFSRLPSVQRDGIIYYERNPAITRDNLGTISKWKYCQNVNNCREWEKHEEIICTRLKASKTCVNNLILVEGRVAQ